MEKQSKIKRITQFFVLVLFVLFSSQALAQQSTIKGLVKDETGVPIIGANVSVKGTTNGVVTDTNGRFIFIQSEVRCCHCYFLRHLYY